MKNFELNFKYKGNRDYVHGTDMYTMIAEYLSAEGFRINNIDFSIHKIVRNNLKGILFNIEDQNPASVYPASIFKFTNNLDESYVIHLFETDTNVNENYTYNEEKIVEAANLNIAEKSIILSSKTPYKNIEIIIALNKALLTQLITDPGKWYFTKITVDKEINAQSPGTISLKLIKNIGSKITKTLICFDNKEQGYIYFSKV